MFRNFKVQCNISRIEKELGCAEKSEHLLKHDVKKDLFRNIPNVNGYRDLACSYK